jgi:hypothetical protein
MTTSTRYQTTEYNRAERVLARLRDIYSSARHFHFTHEQLMAALDRDIYKTRDWEKLTPYYRGMYAGMSRALRDRMWQCDLVWLLYFEGRLVKSEDVPKGRWCDVRGGAHVWRDAPDKIHSDAPEVTADEHTEKHEGRNVSGCRFCADRIAEDMAPSEVAK